MIALETIDGAYVVLQAVATANPTLVGQVSRTRPSSVTLGPTHLFSASPVWDIAHNTSLRNWVGTFDVWIVVPAWDNDQWITDAWTLAQVVTDAFTDAPHFAHANSVAEPVRIREGDYQGADSTTYPAVVVTIGRILYKEGR